MGSNLERERRRHLLRVIAKKRLTTIVRRKQLGGEAAYQKMYKRSVLPRSMNKKFGKMGGR
jgi:hypothetical protein